MVLIEPNKFYTGEEPDFENKRPMANSPIKILLIGDYSIFRTALRMLIEKDERIKVIGETADATEVAELVGRLSPDLVLVDIQDFHDRHLEPLSEISLERVPVLVMCSKPDVAFYQKCLKLGISGLVSKQLGASILYKAITKVCDGELWFDRSIMGATIRQMMDEKKNLIESPPIDKANVMTEREREILDLICKGMKNKGIAETLFITETTVRHHLTSIFNKLQVGSRLELVIYAFKHKLTQIPNGTEAVNENGNGNGNGNGHGNGYHYI